MTTQGQLLPPISILAGDRGQFPQGLWRSGHGLLGQVRALPGGCIKDGEEKKKPPHSFILLTLFKGPNKTLSLLKEETELSSACQNTRITIVPP